MRIRYVVSTTVFWWREHHLSFEQECEFLRNLGYGIELRPNIMGHNDCRYVHRNWSRLREATRDMLVSLHGRNDGPTMEEWTEQLECAKLLGAPIIAKLESLCISEKLGIADWGFAGDVIALAKERDVQLCLETGSLPAVLRIGERFDSIGYCFDTGFAHIDPSHSFREYVDKLAPRTTYLHLTDNYGLFDDHEPPGARGGMPRENWEYLIATLQKYDNDVIGALEMSPCMPGPMIRQGSIFLFDVLGWPDKPAKKAGYNETSYRPT